MPRLPWHHGLSTLLDVTVAGRGIRNHLRGQNARPERVAQNVRPARRAARPGRRTPGPGPRRAVPTARGGDCEPPPRTLAAFHVRARACALEQAACPREGMRAHAAHLRGGRQIRVMQTGSVRETREMCGWLQVPAHLPHFTQPRVAPRWRMGTRACPEAGPKCAPRRAERAR